MHAKFKQGDTVKTPQGTGVIDRVVASNPSSKCRDCGSTNVQIEERSFRYWVKVGDAEQPVKFGEGELSE